MIGSTEHRIGVCGFAEWFNDHYLCHSPDDCDYQEGAGLTFYCGREEKVLAFLKEQK